MAEFRKRKGHPLPGELKQAKTIVESRNEVITNAKREAENIFIWNNSFYVVCNNSSWSGSECFRIDIVPDD